ncbi:MAG: serine/threonine-protein kinase [Planctomycetota bacterium]
MVALQKAHRAVIGGCELIEQIGRGAMGSVFKARQLSMDRIVAIKLLSPRFAEDKEFVARFKREARAAARLSHPNVIQAVDVGQSQGYHYFVMEYVDGRTISSLIEQHGALSEAFCINAAVQIARAIQAAERLGMVHLDIKPSNLMITLEGTAKLADFGVAMQTVDWASDVQPQDVFGTPEYISPEHALGTPNLDSRSDIYSLGATLYKMLTGRRPFNGASVREMVDARFLNDPASPQTLNPFLSDGICAVVAKMMARDRGARYQNAAELIEDLEYVLARPSTGAIAAAASAPQQPTHAPEPVPDSPVAQPVYVVEARKSALGAVVGSFLLVAVGIATFLLVRNPEILANILRTF